MPLFESAPIKSSSMLRDAFRLQQGSEVDDKLDQGIAPAYMDPLMAHNDPEHTARRTRSGILRRQL